MKGDDFVLLVYDGVSAFNQVDALRATAVSINGETVDLTSKDSGGWRQLATAGGGIGSMTITATGVWIAGTRQKEVRALSISRNVQDFQIDDSDQVIEGGFQVTSFEISGDNGAEQLYSLTLESADVPTVT